MFFGKDEKKLNSLYELDIQNNILITHSLFHPIVCAHNSKNQIIAFDNSEIKKFFIVYDYNFTFIRSKDVDQDLNMVNMEINENNGHIYGISLDLYKLFHFDEEFNLIENVPLKNIFPMNKECSENEFSSERHSRRQMKKL